MSPLCAPVDGPLGCSHLLADVKERYDRGVQIFLRDAAFNSFGHILRVGWPDHMMTFNFLKKCHTIFHRSCMFPPTALNDPSFSRSLPALLMFCFCFFINSHPNTPEAISHHDCDLHFSSEQWHSLTQVLEDWEDAGIGMMTFFQHGLINVGWVGSPSLQRGWGPNPQRQQMWPYLQKRSLQMIKLGLSHKDGPNRTMFSYMGKTWGWTHTARLGWYISKLRCQRSPAIGSQLKCHLSATVESTASGVHVGTGHREKALVLI